MELHLSITKVSSVTIGAIRRIKYAIEGAGFEVDVLPTEIEPRLIRITSVEAAAPTEEAGRPFPQTYSDWVSLAEDIKEKDPTWSTSTEVAHALNTILEEERGEAEPDAGYTADDAKRWLTEKAGELGIS